MVLVTLVINSFMLLPFPVAASVVAMARSPVNFGRGQCRGLVDILLIWEKRQRRPLIGEAHRADSPLGENPPHRTSSKAARAVDRASQGGWLDTARCGERLGKPPSYVAKYELGERRLDLWEYLDVAAAIGFDPCELIRALLKE